MLSQEPCAISTEFVNKPKKVKYKSMLILLVQTLFSQSIGNISKVTPFLMKPALHLLIVSE